MLDYRNTPPQGQEHSPAQRLLSRRTRGILPMTPKLLQHEFVSPDLVTTEILARRSRAKQYYDRGISASQQTELQPGQCVYVKPNPQNKHSAWPYGTIEDVTSPRSYTVSTTHGLIRRNRAQVRPAVAPPLSAKTYMSKQADHDSEEPNTSEEFKQSLPQERSHKSNSSLQPKMQSIQPNPGPLNHCSTEPITEPATLQRESSERGGRTTFSQVASTIPTSQSPVRTRSGRAVRPPVRLNL